MIYLAANNSRVWKLADAGYPMGWMMSPAGWISQDEFSFVWSAGYGDEDLGEHDDLREAINACQRDANKRSTQKPRPTRAKGGGKR